MTDRNAIAFGSVTVEPVCQATEVTKRGDCVRSASIRLKKPALGSRHVFAIIIYSGSRSFERAGLMTERRKFWYESGTSFI